MAILKQTTAVMRTFLMVQSSDHISPLTGATVAVSISKNGGAFAASQNTPAVEIGNGWYKISLGVLDTNTIGDLAFHCTAASGDNTDFADQVQPVILSDLNIDAFGNLQISSNIKKNQALLGFTFPMTVNGVVTPGLAVTAQRSLNGVGFGPCAVPTATEVSNGIYSINLAATDMNANTVMLRFTAPGADDRDILIITQP